MSFKVCTACPAVWETREDLLSDPVVQLVGYQADFGRIEAGLFLFNHSCGTTIAIGVKAFCDLHEGPIIAESATGTEKCPGYCLRKDDLRPCPARCACAWVRVVVQKIAAWKKR